jgi:hypothetical protein
LLHKSKFINLELLNHLPSAMNKTIFSFEHIWIFNYPALIIQTFSYNFTLVKGETAKIKLIQKLSLEEKFIP